MNNVLVTGGAGFVGSKVVDLLTESYNVSILDNLLSGPIVDIPPEVTFINLDIRDKQELKKILPKYDIIVHLAGVVGFPACDLDKAESYDINVFGTKVITDLLEVDQRFIFASSTSSYGHQTIDVTEETPLAPLTSYGEHKAEGEKIVYSGKANWIILRPATAFGITKRIRLDLLPNTLSFAALTKGIIDLFEPMVIRPFIHVLDFARIIKHAVDNNMHYNTIYNIGDPNLTMLKHELASYIAEECNAKVIQRSGFDPDQRNYNISFDRLLSTGFKFTPNALKLGVDQIKADIQILEQNPNIFTTPYNFKNYLKEYNHAVSLQYS